MKLLCCVMFKNEEEILERCLNSVKDVVDGFLLVDTGSTDKSIEIAKTFTKNVYEIEFEDFVISKNKVLEIADTLDYDYILWMDADEYLNPSEVELFKQTYSYLHTNNFSELITNIQNNHFDNLGMVYERPRIWKNKFNVRFMGPGIHEFIPYMDNYITEKNIKILHKHKTTNKDYSGANDFYIDILTKYHKKDPDDIRAIFYLARTYFDRNEYSQAIELYKLYRETAIRVNYIYNEEFWYTYYDESKCLQKLNKHIEATEVLKTAISFLPERKETYELISQIYFYTLKDSFSAKKYIEKFNPDWNETQFRLFVEINMNEKILDIGALVYYDLKDLEGALKCLNKLQEINPEYSKDRILYNINICTAEKNNSLKLERFGINTYFDKIFCINLERRSDRWEKINSKFKDFGLSVEKFRGYDGQLLKHFVDENIRVRRTGGYLGCLLSHLEIYKTALSRGYERILILEDDVAIHKNLHLEFERVANELRVENWDLLYLGSANFTESFRLDGNFKKNEVIKNYTIPNFLHYDKATNSWSCLAYAVNRKTMEYILDYYEKNGYVSEIDLVITSEVQNNPDFNCLKVMPQLFMQDDLTSDNDASGRSFDYIGNYLNENYSVREYYV